MTLTQSRKITHEEILQDPSLVELHEIARFFIANKNAIVFPEKYLWGLKWTVCRNTWELYSAKPNLPILEVVTTILGGLNPHIPADMILEITPLIVETWQKEQKGITIRTEELAFA